MRSGSPLPLSMSRMEWTSEVPLVVETRTSTVTLASSTGLGVLSPFRIETWTNESGYLHFIPSPAFFALTYAWEEGRELAYLFTAGRKKNKWDILRHLFEEPDII